ncbi:MAG TPA: hypothetical protein PK277_09165 [Methanoregulaceae archaeon]|nr:hypothetical protein [Methanoregulaceae archaeon]
METEDIDRLCSDFSKCEELLKIKRDACQKMIDNKDEFITALLIQLLDSQSKMNKTTIDVLKMNFANVSLAAVTALIAVSALGISLLENSGIGYQIAALIIIIVAFAYFFFQNRKIQKELLLKWKEWDN